MLPCLGQRRDKETTRRTVEQERQTEGEKGGGREGLRVGCPQDARWPTYPAVIHKTTKKKKIC